MSWKPHPILCLYRTPSQPFRRYIGEVLTQEGYFSHDALDLDGLRDLPAALEGRALLILSADSLDNAEREVIAKWVRGGGAAVLIKPPDDMITALGLTWAEPVSEMYPTTPLGFGRLTRHPWSSHPETLLQILSPMALRQVTGQQPLAMFAARKDEDSTYPAVVEMKCGNGRIVVFWFDLGHTAVLLRQGDPRRATNGVLGDPNDWVSYKVGSLFFGMVDPDFRDVPQGDVWTDLLVSSIRNLTDLNLPIPRVWLYPSDAPALTLLDGDSDVYDWENYADLAEPAAQAGIPYTLNIIPHHLPDLNRAKVDYWLSRGHDFQLHYWPGTSKPTLEEEAKTLKEHTALFKEKAGLPSVAGRAHSVLWPGYTEMAEMLADLGYRLETNFMAMRGHQYGYIGSARPARFMRPDGKIIPLVQQPTLFMDDPMARDKCLLPPRSPGYAYAIMRKVYEESARRYHGVICTCLHPAPPTVTEIRPVQFAMLQAVIDATRELRLPALTARAWSRFCEARRTVELRWTGKGWSLKAGEAVENLTLHEPGQGVMRAGQPWRPRVMNLKAGETVALS